MDRKWFQIHLMTVMILVFVASLCLMLNISISRKLSEKNEVANYVSNEGYVLKNRQSIKVETFGFPYAFGETRYLAAKMPEKMKIGMKAAPQTGPSVIEYKLGTQPVVGTTIQYKFLIIDALLAIGLIIFAGTVSEFLIRRRSRQASQRDAGR